MPEQLSLEQLKFLSTQFEQDWLHIRHLENQLWRLFGFFITLNAAVLATIAAIVSGKFAWQDMIGSLSIAFTLLILGWGYFMLRIFLKWRKEFVLHFYDLNKIRTEGFKIGPKRYTIWTLEKPSLMKATSVFFYACFGVITTTAIVSSAFYHIAIISFNIIGFSNLSTIFLAFFIWLFLLEDLLWNGYQTMKNERRTKLFQFDENRSREKEKQEFVIMLIIFLESLWIIAVILLNGILGTDLLVALAFSILFFGKAIRFSRPILVLLQRNRKLKKLLQMI